MSFLLPFLFHFASSLYCSLSLSLSFECSCMCMRACVWVCGESMCVLVTRTLVCLLDPILLAFNFSTNLLLQRPADDRTIRTRLVKPQKTWVRISLLLGQSSLHCGCCKLKYLEYWKLALN